jgi:3-hydroxy acid dehydrogenase / malonic semialdehyde reductase
MSKIVFITGSSSGFGKAFAEKFAANGYNLILNARRQDKLFEIKSSLENQYGTKILLLPFDVQNKDEVSNAISSLPTEWQAVSLLINNAGLALGRDYFEVASLDDWETMLDTNVKGLLYVTKALVPYMIKIKSGHIINIGSTAGKEVYEKGNVYCATKHAVDALSKAMRIELLRHGIKVTAIHPGAAETEFSIVRFKGDRDSAAKVYEGYEPLAASDVAEIAYFTASLPAHVCVNDLVVTCTAQANSIYLYKG